MQVFTTAHFTTVTVLNNDNHIEDTELYKIIDSEEPAAGGKNGY